MPPRTYLTTAPGLEPSDATGRDAREPRERYVPGLAAPREPRIASRWRPAVLTVLSLLVVAVVTVLIVRLGAASQAEDPALGEPPAREAPSLPDG